jgi:hypothetical protein
MIVWFIFLMYDFLMCDLNVWCMIFWCMIYMSDVWFFDFWFFYEQRLFFFWNILRIWPEPFQLSFYITQ